MHPATALRTRILAAPVWLSCASCYVLSGSTDPEKVWNTGFRVHLQGFWQMTHKHQAAGQQRLITVMELAAV